MPDYKSFVRWRNHLLGTVIGLALAVVVIGGVVGLAGTRSGPDAGWQVVLASYLYGAWFLLYFFVSEGDNETETEPSAKNFAFDIVQTIAGIVAIGAIASVLGVPVATSIFEPTRALLLANLAVAAISGLSLVLFSNGGIAAVDDVRVLGLIIGLVTAVICRNGIEEGAVLATAIGSSVVQWVLLGIYIRVRRKGSWISRPSDA